jgi:hypothetical protein
MSLTLRIEHPKNNQLKGVRFASEYSKIPKPLKKGIFITIV